MNLIQKYLCLHCYINLTLSDYFDISEVWEFKLNFAKSASYLRNRRALRSNIQTHRQTQIFLSGFQWAKPNQNLEYASLPAHLFHPFNPSHLILSRK